MYTILTVHVGHGAGEHIHRERSIFAVEGDSPKLIGCYEKLRENPETWLSENKWLVRPISIGTAEQPPEGALVLQNEMLPEPGLALLIIDRLH